MDISDLDPIAATAFPLAEIIESSPDFIGVADAEGRLHFLNRAARRTLGLNERSSLAGLSLTTLHSAESAEFLAATAIPEACRRGAWVGANFLRTPDGSEIPVSQTLVAHRPGNGEVALLSVIMRPLGGDRVDAARLVKENHELQAVLEEAGAGVALVRSGVVARANHCLAGLLGRQLPQLIGAPVGTVWPEAANLDAARGRAELPLARADGSMIWLDVSAHRFGERSEIWVCRDVTDRHQREAELHRLANFDAATGLFTRHAFRQALAQAIAEGGTEILLAVAMIDLPHFETVAESLGQRAAELLLRLLGQRFTETCRPGDVAARLSGHRFCLMLRPVANAEAAVARLRELQVALTVPLEHEGVEFNFNPTMGLALYPDHGVVPEALLRNASSALLQTTREGGESLEVYSSAITERLRERLALRSDLSHAIENGQLFLAFQPQVDAGNGMMVGVEALVRWRHPRLGLVPPALFIPLAEDSSLIVAIGDWVMRESCRQAAQWREGGREMKVAVNLSARQFRQEDLVTRVTEALRVWGLPARLLEIELTESVLVSDPENVVRTLKELKTLGVQLALDDFGTGYSSLSYLMRFPIDYLKIDRSFVSSVTSNADHSAIARAIIGIAHSLGMRTIAEGVEDEAQAAFLKNNGCDVFQGFFFAYPMSPDEVRGLLDRGARLDAGAFRPRNRERSVLVFAPEASTREALVAGLATDGYQLFAAPDLTQAFDILARYAVGVVVCDFAGEPGQAMQLLRNLREMHPRCARLAVADADAAGHISQAVNQGAAYRVLARGAADAELRRAVHEGFLAFDRATANERLQAELRHANDSLQQLNHELQQLVVARTERAEHDEVSLDVIREMLLAVPLPMLGYDAEGTIAVANYEAERVLAGGALLLGQSVTDLLDVPLTLAEASQTLPRLAEIEGSDYHVLLRRMGQQSRSQGTMLVLVPVRGEGDV